MAFRHFLLGSHTFIVTALGSCVKWPLRPVYATDHEVGPWKMAFFHVPTSMVRFLYKLIYKAIGSLTRCKLNWTKENDHSPKNECADFFFKYMPKLGIFEKTQVWPFSCLLLGFTCLHFLLNVLKMWLEKLPTLPTKENNNNNKIVHVQCNLHVTCTLCCTLSIICNPLHHVYSNSWVLDVPRCLVKHVGASLRGRARKKGMFHGLWYDQGT